MTEPRGRAPLTIASPGYHSPEPNAQFHPPISVPPCPLASSDFKCHETTQANPSACLSPSTFVPSVMTTELTSCCLTEAQK